MAVLCLNSGFCLKSISNFDDSGKLVNKGILLLEYVDKIMGEED